MNLQNLTAELFNASSSTGSMMRSNRDFDFTLFGTFNAVINEFSTPGLILFGLGWVGTAAAMMYAVHKKCWGRTPAFFPKPHKKSDYGYGSLGDNWGNNEEASLLGEAGDDNIRLVNRSKFSPAA